MPPATLQRPVPAVDTLPEQTATERPRLSAQVKLGIYHDLLARRANQQQAARRYGVDRSTVARIRRIADDAVAQALAGCDRPSPVEGDLPAARLAQLEQVAAQQTIALRLLRAKQALGLPPGPVPARVDAACKRALLDLVTEAGQEGLSANRACALLGLDVTRVWRWRQRAAEDRLADATARVAGHGITAAEERAILDLAARWGEYDRSVRRLAHRGSLEGRVWVSPATVRRTLAAHGVTLPAPHPSTPRLRVPQPLAGTPQQPNMVWTYDLVRLPGSGQLAVALVDVVSHVWLATVLTDGDPCAAAAKVREAALAADAERARPTPRLAEQVTIVPSVRWQIMVPACSAEADPRACCHPAGLAGDTTELQIISPLQSALADQPDLGRGDAPDALPERFEQARVRANDIRLDAAHGYLPPTLVHEGTDEAARQARTKGLATARAARRARPADQAARGRDVPALA